MTLIKHFTIFFVYQKFYRKKHIKSSSKRNFSNSLNSSNLKLAIIEEFILKQFFC